MGWLQEDVIVIRLVRELVTVVLTSLRRVHAKYSYRDLTGVVTVVPVKKDKAIVTVMRNARLGLSALKM